MRRTPGVVIAVLTIALTCGATSPSAWAAAGRTITYATERMEAPQGDYAGFRDIVATTLDDPRGWSLAGRVSFREVRSGGELTIALASPASVAGFAPCSAYYSCRVGGLVLINSDRWRDATDSYRGRELLHSYRQMVINHEVGHALGLGHVSCPRADAPAAVMQQQSKGLDGCRRNVWPLAIERRQHAALVGVRAGAVPPPLVLGRRASHVELGTRRREVLATLGRPQRRAVNGGGASIDIYTRPRVVVAYARGRVAAITTRSRADVGAGALGPGRRLPARLRSRCGSGVGSSRCVLALHRDGRRTTLLLRDGRVAAIRLEDMRTSSMADRPRARHGRPALSVRNASGRATSWPLNPASGPLHAPSCPGWPWATDGCE